MMRRRAFHLGSLTAPAAVLAVAVAVPVAAASEAVSAAAAAHCSALAATPDPVQTVARCVNELARRWSGPQQPAVHFDTLCLAELLPAVVTAARLHAASAPAGVAPLPHELIDLPPPLQ